MSTAKKKLTTCEPKTAVAYARYSSANQRDVSIEQQLRETVLDTGRGTIYDRNMDELNDLLELNKEMPKEMDEFVNTHWIKHLYNSGLSETELE